MCRKKIEIRFTIINSTSKNILNRVFGIEKLLEREVIIFPEKIKGFNMLFRMHKTFTK